jgi:CheY-like chemotaxis protein
MNELKRVVFVEDDPDIAELIDIALNTIGGMSAIGFSSGHMAIKQAAAHAPQMLLLDVMMPEIDGPETLKILRRQSELQDVPAIFLTAKVHPNEIQRLRELGANDVLAKPFDPMNLADKLRSIWQAVAKAAM